MLFDQRNQKLDLIYCQILHLGCYGLPTAYISNNEKTVYIYIYIYICCNMQLALLGMELHGFLMDQVVVMSECITRFLGGRFFVKIN